MRARTIGRVVVTVLLVGALGAMAVWLWPNVEALLTVGALFGLLAVNLALISWSQRRRRRGDEGSTHRAEGTEAIMFQGFPPGGGAG